MKLKNTYLFSLIVICLLVSCQSDKKAIVVLTSTVNAVTNTVVPQPTLELKTTSPSPSTATATLLVEPIPIPPTATIAALETATTSPVSITPSVIPATLTPLPTLEGQELRLAVERLLADPMNCDVPCWWGAVPGVTSIDEIKHAISPYNFDIHEYYDGKDWSYLRLGIRYVEKRNDFEINMVYSFSNSILTDVTAYYPLSISEILAKYGQPDEVWLSAMNDPREQPPLIWFVIVYFRKGIGIGYVVDGDFQDDVITGCVASEDTERLQNLRLLVPDSATEYKDFPNIFTEERLYLPLEEATNLTVEDFMQLFSDSGQPKCIETPVELWE